MKRHKYDIAFWLYILVFGALTFWGAVQSMVFAVATALLFSLFVHGEPGENSANFLRYLPLVSGIYACGQILNLLGVQYSTWQRGAALAGTIAAMYLVLYRLPEFLRHRGR